MSTIAQTPASSAPSAQVAPAAQVESAQSSVTAAGDMCRLVVIGPTSRVELAVPSHIPVAELLPTIVGHLDPALATRGLEHGGWVLQRLGHPPLDENYSTSASGLLDGDVLYLRPRSEELSEAQYDDLVDGVRSMLNARGDEWTAERTRTAALAALAIACATLSAVSVTLGWLAPIIAGALAAMLTGAGALVGRFWEHSAGQVLLFGAVAAAGVAGATLPDALFIGANAGLLVEVAMTALAVGAVAGIGAYARGGFQPVLMAISGAAAIVILALALPLLMALSMPAAAAISLILLLMAARVLPRLSVWIAGLEIDSVPTSAEEFQSDLETIDADDLGQKSERLHRVVAAFWVAWAAVQCAAICVLALAEGWAPLVLTVVGAVATLLQSRELPATMHRTALLIAATVPLILLAFVSSLRLEMPWQFTIIIGLVMTVAYGVIAVRMLPGRRLAPTWGRSGDILHWLCAIAIPALVLAVTGFYEWIADLF